MTLRYYVAPCPDGASFAVYRKQGNTAPVALIAYESAAEARLTLSVLMDAACPDCGRVLCNPSTCSKEIV